MKKNPPSRYRAGTLDKGLEVLETLERARAPLRIHDVVAATGFDRAAVFRLLCTLEGRGYIERLPDKRYHAKTRGCHSRIGYLAPLSGNAFRRDVTLGLRSAATDAGIELVTLNTSEDPSSDTIANVQVLLDARVDLVIMFQPVDSLAHVLADRFISEGLPVISVETAVPGALFFGGNSYRAGILAGQALGKFARANWNSSFDKLVLLESSLTSPGNQARLSGAVEGLHDILGEIKGSKILHIDGLAHRNSSATACMELVRSLPPRNRLLISAFNDVSAMGALDAFRAVKRERWTAIVGQNGTAESRRELAVKDSALIASVAYFPEKYGEKLVRLARAVQNRERTPLAVYTDHVLLDRDSVQRYYPGELAISSEDL